MAKKAVVFGGSGFLGSHVADELSDSGHEVHIFDKVRSPYLRDGQKMIVGDILNKEQVIEAVRGAAYVYNFAGLADLDDARDNPEATVQLNILGNLNIMTAARDSKVGRFMFASTIYVFSESGSFYRVSKQAAEKYVEAFHERYGLNYTILRYGSLYGRRADSRNGIYRILRQALSERKIVYKGNPESQREYIHVTDAARLSVRALQDEYCNTHLVLTGPQKLSAKDLLSMIREMMGKEIEIKFNPDESVSGHYVLTPYSFKPKIGLRLVGETHVDMGQGLLDCMSVMYKPDALNSQMDHGADDL